MTLWGCLLRPRVDWGGKGVPQGEKFVADVWGKTFGSSPHLRLVEVFTWGDGSVLLGLGMGGCRRCRQNPVVMTWWVGKDLPQGGP